MKNIMFALALVGLVGFAGCHKEDGDKKPKHENRSMRNKNEGNMKHKHEGSSMKNKKGTCSHCNRCKNRQNDK